MKSRIDSAIARVTASKAADSVLAEIGKTHVLIERERWERVHEAAWIAVREFGAESRVGLNDDDLEPT